MALMRQPLLALSRSERVRDWISTSALTAEMVRRYVPGETEAEAVRCARELVADGLQVTLDHLGEDVTDPEQAAATTQTYVALLNALAAQGLVRHAEVSVKLSSIGLMLAPSVTPGGGHRIALEHARTICRAARNAGTTLTVDMEDHTTTEATLAVLRELRKDFPETGAVLQAALRRTERDCQVLAYDGSRVRLCKGAYAEPDVVAYQRRVDVDRAFVRCLKVLMAGHGYPMVATHDPRMIAITSSLASRHARPAGTYEFQMLYGVRPEEQRRLAAAGEKVRVYLPYGAQWYSYLMRRLAERPQNLTFFAKSLISTT